MSSFVTLTDCIQYAAGLFTKGVQRCNKGQGVVWVHTSVLNWILLLQTLWQFLALRKLHNVLKTIIFCCMMSAVFGYGYVRKWWLSFPAMWWSVMMISLPKRFLDENYVEETSNGPRLESIMKIELKIYSIFDVGWLAPILNIHVWLVGSRQSWTSMFDWLAHAKI